MYVLVPTSTKGEESSKVTEGTTEVTYVYKDVKEEASKEIDKALSEKESKIKENPELTNEEKEKAIEEAKKAAEDVKKSIEEGKTTEWVDEKGNPIKPVTPGSLPAGSTPNYKLVGTVTNQETGKVTHIFKPATSDKPATVWVDVNGKPVKPLAEGDNPAGEIPGYALVETINVKETGDVIHVFKRTTNGRPQKEDSTNGGSVTPSQPGSPARPSTNSTSPVKPTDQSQTETPVVPADPSQPTTPVMPSAPATAKAEAKSQVQPPNTGTKVNTGLGVLGLLGILSGFGLVARKRKED